MVGRCGAPAVSVAVGAGIAASSLSRSTHSQQSTPAPSLAISATSHLPGSKLKISSGEISTHVISKLGKASVDGAKVSVSYNADLSAGARSCGWRLLREAALSTNGGIDDLVPVGELQRGLYLLEFDFSGVDEAARKVYRKEAEGVYVPLNSTGFFLAPRSSITLKIEDPDSLNHLVLSVGDKELTARPGVRAH
uniref:Uncharacterized protein n=1 Tax=Coccolithus braarudii TaxID=221442 RepID=A0A7S0PZW2_9EUKA